MNCRAPAWSSAANPSTAPGLAWDLGGVRSCHLGILGFWDLGFDDAGGGGGDDEW